MSRMLRSMSPGSESDPTMVYVLPEPVAPYAKTVAFSPRSTPCTSGATVASYICTLFDVPSNARSNMNLFSICFTPCAGPSGALRRLCTTPSSSTSGMNFESSVGSSTTTHWSSTVRVMERPPDARSPFVRGRMRVKTDKVAWDTPFFLRTRVNFNEASTSSCSCASWRF